MKKYSRGKNPKSRNGFKKGHIHTKETKEKIGIANRFSLKGRKIPEEVRKKMSESHKGSKSYLWKGGISKVNRSERQNIMNTIEYKIWRTKVFERDNYTCQLCGQQGGYLEADHIKSWALYPKLRLVVNNGRTLCKKCHKTTFKKLE